MDRREPDQVTIESVVSTDRGARIFLSDGKELVGLQEVRAVGRLAAPSRVEIEALLLAREA